jgi:hypothetical protein
MAIGAHYYTEEVDMKKRMMLLIGIGFAYGLFLHSVGFNLLTWQYWVFVAFECAFIFFGAL